jgi:hypothetical protein
MATEFGTVVIRIPEKFIRFLDANNVTYRMEKSTTDKGNVSTRKGEKSIKLETSKKGDEIEVINNGVKTEIPTRKRKAYPIEKVIKERMKDGKKQYYVKWKNYDNSYNDWIDADNVKEAPEDELDIEGEFKKIDEHEKGNIRKEREIFELSESEEDSEEENRTLDDIHKEKEKLSDEYKKFAKYSSSKMRDALDQHSKALNAVEKLKKKGGQIEKIKELEEEEEILSERFKKLKQIDEEAHEEYWNKRKKLDEEEDELEGMNNGEKSESNDSENEKQLIQPHNRTINIERMAKPKYQPHEGEFKVEDLDEKINKYMMTGMNLFKTDIKGLQIFPTPKEISEYVLSQVEFDTKDLHGNNKELVILEPTAGIGHFVTAILKKYPSAIVNACESVPQFQKFLSHFPRTRVLKQNDFFNVKTNKKYHLIAMNPPFSIKRGEKGKRNYVDFILHAVKLLAFRDSELLSIIPQGNKMTEELKDILSEEGETYEITPINIQFKHKTVGRGKSFLKDFETKFKMSLLHILRN